MRAAAAALLLVTDRYPPFRLGNGSAYGREWRSAMRSTIETRRCAVWWQDLLWGFWNGLTAWIVLIVHVFGGWDGTPVYDAERSGNWYDFGFLVGAGSPFFGAFGARGRGSARQPDSD